LSGSGVPIVVVVDVVLVDVPPPELVGGGATPGNGPPRIQLLLKVFQWLASQFEAGGTPA
jgi:hypothetical protein